MPEASPIRVLLIEDDDDVRTSTEQALSLAGFDVDAFANAERAYQGRHEKDEPDLCEEGEIGPSPPGLDHAPPGKAPGV